VRSGERPLLLALLRNNQCELTELLIAAGAHRQRGGACAVKPGLTQELALPPVSLPGADAAAVDTHGLTPLHWLAQRPAPATVLTPLVEAVLGAGADVEAREQLYGACMSMSSPAPPACCFSG
jgi:ankyrin repeat protein